MGKRMEDKGKRTEDEGFKIYMYPHLFLPTPGKQWPLEGQGMCGCAQWGIRHTSSSTIPILSGVLMRGEGREGRTLHIILDISTTTDEQSVSQSCTGDYEKR